MKQLFLKSIICLFILVSFQNCEKESVISESKTNNDNQNKLLVKEYSFGEIANDLKFKNSINKIHSITKQNKSSYDGKSRNETFTIDSSKIKMITHNHKVTYTMLITREDYEIGSFENLVIELDSLGKTRAFIIKYFPAGSIDIFDEHGSHTFEGERQITEIDFDASGFSKNSSMKTEISCSWSVMCDYGGNEHTAGGNCTQTYLVLYCGGTSAGGGIPGGGSDTSDYDSSTSYETGGSGTGGSPSGGGSGSSSTSTSTSETEAFITATTLTPLEIEINNFFNNLTQEQEECLGTGFNGMFLNEATNFLKSNQVPRLPRYDGPLISLEAKAFATQAIDAFCAGDIEGFEEALFLKEQLVYFNPDIPIENLQEYLKCFNTNQNAEITIYIDQPVANSNVVGSPTQKAGHSYIGISQGTLSRTYGFYPIGNATPWDPVKPSIMGDDSGRAYDVSISFNVNASILSQIINYSINISNSEFDLENRNCTNLAIDIAIIAGMDIDKSECHSNWGLGQGLSPAKFGQHIRNNYNDAIYTKNVEGGLPKPNSNSSNCQ